MSILGNQVNITVFSTGPSCQRCATVERHLEKRGLTYTEVRLDQDRNTAVELRKQGFNLAPVVKVEKDGDVRWSEGYRPDFIDSLAS